MSSIGLPLCVLRINVEDVIMLEELRVEPTNGWAGWDQISVVDVFGVVGRQVC